MASVRMRSTSAGPAGCRDAGKVYPVSDAEGLALVNEGTADWVEKPAARVVPTETAAPVIETATMPEREQAVAPRQQKRGRR